MGNKNSWTNLITTSLFLVVAITASIPTKVLANNTRLCDYTNNPNDLKDIPGYPSKKPEKTLFHELPFRASGGSFIIIMKNNSLCHINMDVSTEAKDKAKALKIFSQIYSGTKPIRICELPASRISMTCKKL